MKELQEWAAPWGDLTSVVGLLLSLVGFAVTIVQVRRAKSAAEQARQAAIADLSSAMAVMDEIKRLQRNGIWPLLPDRYSELRRRLIAIRQSHAQLTEEQRESLSVTIDRFAELERLAG